MRPSRRALANAIRALSMDAGQKAGSGYPGAPMGMAVPVTEVYRRFGLTARNVAGAVQSLLTTTTEEIVQYAREA